VIYAKEIKADAVYANTIYVHELKVQSWKGN